MDTLQVDQPYEGVTRITLDRPERLNAMNATLIAELHEALADIAVDRACRVVVLTGAGRGFCAGIDLDMLPRLQQGRDLPSLYVERLQHLDELVDNQVAPLPQQVHGMARVR